MVLQQLLTLTGGLNTPKQQTNPLYYSRCRFKTNGYIVQRSISAAAQYTANFYVKFTTTKYAVTPADGDCSNYGSWFGYAWGLSTSAKTISSVYIGKYAAANNYGGWYGIPVIIIFSGY